MAYNPYSAINAIYKRKGQWDTANRDGDDEKKNKAAREAQDYYAELRRNGYGSVADELAGSDYNASKFINSYYAQTGRTATRPYMQSLGKKYGLSESEVNKLIEYNDTTGEISFGGKKIGLPDAEVDGVSYWSDTTALDNAFNDYISRSGRTRSKSAAVDQENDSLFQKYNQEYEDLKQTNPFTTEEAKSILAKYDLAGLQGRDNALASNAGSSGGNIDSFAAANALRQQAALVNQGQQAVLAAHQQKLEHARALLSDMGVNIDRVFNEDETAKNNDVKRKSEIAAVSGYTPAEWSIQNDAFLKNFVDESGKLKAEYNDTDFQELINNAKASGNTDLANKYAILRGLKIFGNFDEYGRYLSEGDVAYLTPQRTADYDLTKQQIDSAERIANNNAATQQAVAQIGADAQKDVAEMEAQAALKVAQDEEKKEEAKITEKTASENMLKWLGWANGQKKEFSLGEDGIKYVGSSDYTHQTELLAAALNDRNLSDTEKNAIASLFNPNVVSGAQEVLNRPLTDDQYLQLIQNLQRRGVIVDALNPNMNALSKNINKIIDVASESGLTSRQLSDALKRLGISDEMVEAAIK